MNKLMMLVYLGFTLAVSVSVQAATQQDKMKSCSAEAKANKLMGQERRAFMSKCLRKDYVLKPGANNSGNKAAAMPTQQDKMRACSADATAKNLRGDERGKFMRSCLKE